MAATGDSSPPQAVAKAIDLVLNWLDYETRRLGGTMSPAETADSRNMAQFRVVK